jgi:hypothetical protein
MLVGIGITRKLEVFYRWQTALDLTTREYVVTFGSFLEFQGIDPAIALTRTIAPFTAFVKHHEQKQSNRRNSAKPLQSLPSPQTQADPLGNLSRLVVPPCYH